MTHVVPHEYRPRPSNDDMATWFASEVVKFNASQKTAEDLYQYSVAIWRATKLGGMCLSWPDVRSIIKASTTP